MTENLKMLELGARVQDEDEEDEDENFSKNERTQRQENLDFFAKLMKSKVEESCSLLINLFN